jgi:general secretion pathway protein G
MHKFRSLFAKRGAAPLPCGVRAAGRAGQRGMTLVEIMVVVVIISLVAGVVGVAVLQRLGDAQKKVAYTQIRTISDALDLYKLSLRNYPSTAEGLNALTAPKGNEKPFMNSVPKDPWNNDYVYIYPGTHNTNGFDLMSYGPDGVQGGGDDIGNWDQSTTN